MNLKKLLIALPVIACLCSCERSIVSPGDYAYYTVRERDWELVGRPGTVNSFYQYSFDEPKLTRRIYEEGAVLGYIVANYGMGDEVLRPLPDTWPTGEYPAMWTESVSFDYKPGLVTFFVGYSDFATNVPPPTMTFKLVMIR
jgi:hypothetical protein